MKKFVTPLPKDNVSSDWRYFGLVLMIAPVLIWLSSSVWIWWAHRVYYLEEYSYPVQWDLATVLGYDLLVVVMFYFPAPIVGYLLYRKPNAILALLGIVITLILGKVTILLFFWHLHNYIVELIIQPPPV